MRASSSAARAPAPHRAHRARSRRRRANSTSSSSSSASASHRDDDDDARGVVIEALDFNGAIRAHAATHDCAAPMSAMLARDMALGDGGTDVALVQRLLGARASGVYDGETVSAVSRWQRSRGMPASGYFGARAREQVAAEEELWREAGGAALAEYLRAEVLRQTSEAEARRPKLRFLTPAPKDERSFARAGAVAATTSSETLRASSSLSSSASSYALAIGAIGAAIAIGTTTYRAFRAPSEAPATENDAVRSIGTDVDEADAAANKVRASETISRTLTVARDACASSVSGVISNIIGLARAFEEASATWRDVFETPPIDDTRAEVAVADELASIPGSFDKDGRWWESPIAPMASPASPAASPKPTRESRVDEMRNRWSRLRVHKKPTTDERESSKRVADFLGSKSRRDDASSS